MALIAIMPKKYAVFDGECKTLLRVILAIFVCVGAVNEVKCWMPRLSEVPTRCVAIMLDDAVCAGMILKLSADDTPIDKVKVILRQFLLGVMCNREA